MRCCGRSTLKSQTRFKNSHLPRFLCLCVSTGSPVSGSALAVRRASDPRLMFAATAQSFIHRKMR